MWHAMFTQELPFWEKVVRTVVVYALIAVLFRLSGKRSLATFSNLDFVVMFLLANVVQNAVIGNDNSVTGGIIGAVTLVALNAAMNRLVEYSAWFARVFNGAGTTVIRHGTEVPGAVNRIGLRAADLEHAVRLQNGDSVRQVESGVLEPGGHLLLTLKPAERGATHGEIEMLQAQLTRIESLLQARGTS